MRKRLLLILALPLALVVSPPPGPAPIRALAVATEHPCPAILYSNVTVPLKVNNVGGARFTAYHPQRAIGTGYRVWYSPASWSTETIGSVIWAAEGSYLADCFHLFGGAHAVKPVINPTTGYAYFNGTFWKVGETGGCGDAPDDELMYDCTGSGGGGSGDGDTGGSTDDHWLCSEYDLEEGYYDVYVDGEYSGTIYCSGNYQT